jgi:hypothetical protein
VRKTTTEPAPAGTALELLIAIRDEVYRQNAILDRITYKLTDLVERQRPQGRRAAKRTEASHG